MWALASVLENDGAVGLLADQAFTRGPHITFMGREVSSNPLAPKLASQFECDIHPARCVRLPGGRFRIQLCDAIDMVRKENGVLYVLVVSDCEWELDHGFCMIFRHGTELVRVGDLTSDSLEEGPKAGQSEFAAHSDLGLPAVLSYERM